MSEVVKASILPIRGNHIAFVEKIHKLKPGDALTFTLPEENLKNRSTVFSVVGNLRRKQGLNVLARSLGDGKYAVIREKGTNGKEPVAKTKAVTNDTVE